MRTLSMIVAVSANNVIGNDGDLPWRLSADLRRFKKLTMGHHIIMGRKTFESIGRVLPGRISVIVTRNEDYAVDGMDELDANVAASDSVPVTGFKVANSVEQAIELCGDDACPFVTGGAEIYRQSLRLVTEIELTRVHTEIDGDTFLPAIDWDDWELVSDSRHPQDDRNEAEYSFLSYRRI